MNIETNIEVVNRDFIVGTGGNIETKIELEFILNMSKNIKINIIDEVSIDENRDKQIYSMIIYFVKPGDTLWKIAKEFRSTVEDIARVNNIEDINKIYPSQQLFIPKYVYTRRQQTA